MLNDGNKKWAEVFLDQFNHEPAAPTERELEERRRRRSEKRVARGGLPNNAIEWMNRQRRPVGEDALPWTCTLNVDELAMVEDSGYEAIGQVMGVSIHQIGDQWRNTSWRNGASRYGLFLELDSMSHAVAAARKLAVGRLVQEAIILRADGVVGVQIVRKATEWDLKLAEFRAIGTAIRLRRAYSRTPNLPPFVCTLSPADFWKLKAIGMEPIGLVGGNCTYYCGIGAQAPNPPIREIPQFSQALQAAREIALGRLDAEGRELEAEGVIGTTMEWSAEKYLHNTNMVGTETVYHFLAMGTAVRTVKFDYDEGDPPGNVLSLGHAGKTRASTLTATSRQRRLRKENAPQRNAATVTWRRMRI